MFYKCSEIKLNFTLTNISWEKRRHGAKIQRLGCGHTTYALKQVKFNFRNQTYLWYLPKNRLQLTLTLFWTFQSIQFQNCSLIINPPRWDAWDLNLRSYPPSLPDAGKERRYFFLPSPFQKNKAWSLVSETSTATAMLSC